MLPVLEIKDRKDVADLILKEYFNRAEKIKFSAELRKEVPSPNN